MTELLAEKVKQLLVAIGSVEALEVLLTLARTPDRYMSPSQVAAMLGKERQIDRSLEKLAQLNLIDVRLGNDILYRYLPVTTDLAETVSSLALEYEERKYLVLRAVRFTSS